MKIPLVLYPLPMVLDSGQMENLKSAISSNVLPYSSGKQDMLNF